MASDAHHIAGNARRHREKLHLPGTAAAAAAIDEVAIFHAVVGPPQRYEEEILGSMFDFRPV